VKHKRKLLEGKKEKNIPVTVKRKRRGNEGYGGRRKGGRDSAGVPRVPYVLLVVCFLFF